MSRRALLIGYGRIGQKRARLLRDFGWDLTIWEPNMGRGLVAKADGFGDVQPGGDTVRDLPPTATVAFVCSPPANHAEHTIACLDVGCHVFIEKPIAHTMAAAVAIQDAAADNDRHVMVGCNYRFADLLPVSMINIHAIDIVMQYDLAITRPNWRESYVNDPDQGGICLDSGAHAIDLARHLAGPIGYMHHTAARQPGKLNATVEDVADIQFKHENGITTIIDLSWTGKSKRCVTFELKTGIRVQSELWDGTDEMFRLEVETFLRCIEEGDAPPNGPTEAIDTLRWCLKARNQIRASLLLPAVPA